MAIPPMPSMGVALRHSRRYWILLGNWGGEVGEVSPSATVRPQCLRKAIRMWQHALVGSGLLTKLTWGGDDPLREGTCRTREARYASPSNQTGPSSHGSFSLWWHLLPHGKASTHQQYSSACFTNNIHACFTNNIHNTKVVNVNMLECIGNLTALTRLDIRQPDATLH